MSSYESWGMYPKVTQKVMEPDWLSEIGDLEGQGPVIAYGLGRSYGDCALNDGGTIISTRKLKRIISFNQETGLLCCEAGMSLKDILDFAVPRGWFLPVTPGTKFVTVGGAIANDVHGKNHHRAGTFGRHVRSFNLLRSSGEQLTCSENENADYYAATIGGMGLTGLVTTTELQLKKVSGPMIDGENIKFCGLDEFFSISSESDTDYEYTVAWLDCVSSGANFARGIFMRGNHSSVETSRAKCLTKGAKAAVPFYFPARTLNKWTVSAFNFAYYHKQFSKRVEYTGHYDSFFYPLDLVNDWNRIYGKQGMLQFQCVVPHANGKEAVSEILRVIVKSGNASFLAVLKEFGDVKSPGMVSFPVKGVTLCLDFANHGKKTFDLFRKLDSMVSEAGGRMYSAKDALMTPEGFRSYYPEIAKLEAFIDPEFSSSFSRRVMINKSS